MSEPPGSFPGQQRHDQEERDLMARKRESAAIESKMNSIRQVIDQVQAARRATERHVHELKQAAAKQLAQVTGIGGMRSKHSTCLEAETLRIE